MKVDDLALVQGWPHTRATLRRWNTAPLRQIAPWALGSLMIAVALLGATWLVAVNHVPDLSPHRYPGLTRPAGRSRTRPGAARYRLVPSASFSANAARLRRSIAAAISSGNASGVQANAGTPMAASAAALSWS